MNNAKIANRDTGTENLLVKCDSCKHPIRPTMIMRNGKKRMITACHCMFILKNTADTKILLG